MKPDRIETEQLNSSSSDGIHLVSVYRSLLKIVAGLEEREYTESNLRQTVGLQSDDPADPASE